MAVTTRSAPWTASSTLATASSAKVARPAAGHEGARALRVAARHPHPPQPAHAPPWPRGGWPPARSSRSRPGRPHPRGPGARVATPDTAAVRMAVMAEAFRKASGSPVSPLKSVTAPWCASRPCARFPGKTPTIFTPKAPSEPPRHAGITAIRPGAPGGRRIERRGWIASPRPRAASTSAIASMQASMGRRRRTSASPRTRTFTALQLAASRGFSTRHTFSATIRCPSAVGWMPSAWFSRATPATPSSRNGTKAAPLRLRDLGKQRAKTPGVVGTQVRRGLACRRARASVAAPACRPGEDAPDVRARRLGLLATQAVVGSGLHHQHRHGLAQQPVDAPQGARRRLAADTRVHHPVAQAGFVGLLLDERRPRLRRDRVRSPR